MVKITCSDCIYDDSSTACRSNCVCGSGSLRLYVPKQPVETQEEVDGTNGDT